MTPFLLALLLAAPRPVHVIPTLDSAGGESDRGRTEAPEFASRSVESHAAGRKAPLADASAQPGFDPDAAGRAVPPATAEPSPGTPIRTTSGHPSALQGVASWYRATGMIAAAGPALRAALGPSWRGRTVTVCAERCVVVRLTDHCRCIVDGSERLIDLSDDAFRAIAPLSRGLVRVTVG